jgi:hypothetical protein
MHGRKLFNSLIIAGLIITVAAQPGHAGIFGAIAKGAAKLVQKAGPVIQKVKQNLPKVVATANKVAEKAGNAAQKAPEGSKLQTALNGVASLANKASSAAQKAIPDVAQVPNNPVAASDGQAPIVTQEVADEVEEAQRDKAQLETAVAEAQTEAAAADDTDLHQTLVAEQEELRAEDISDNQDEADAGIELLFRIQDGWIGPGGIQGSCPPNLLLLVNVLNNQEDVFAL